MTRRGWILFVALCVLWGIPYLLIKVAVRDLSPASLVFLRTATGAVLLLPFVLLRGNLRPVLARWRPIALFTFGEMAVPWLLLADAERHVTSSLAGLVIAATPLVGALASRLSAGHEPLGARRMSGLAVGLAGVVALLGLDLGRGDARAVAELAVVVLGYALAPRIVARRLSDLPALDVVAVSLAMCALAYAPFGIAQLPTAWPPAEALGAVAGLGVLCTALAFTLFFQLIAEVGPVRATVVAYVNPAVAVAAGVTLLGEPFTVGTAVGFALILGGSWLATSGAAVRARPAAPASAPAAPGAVAPAAAERAG
ncbi:DMT family transporter [Anaeromyxobacter sp. PSR-1]|uniref:DMT family transporter n=1 Tax=Anaeromyxobacter sp. PSR-1 TaxID=1300915 RepID=UPI0005DABCDA|nr:EamA family transporter [Anaeromyxobacter sp. PSR-1]GAO04595.1 putative transporter [Anaeromyxobacter sp. PSR-1]